MPSPPVSPPEPFGVDALFAPAARRGGGAAQRPSGGAGAAAAAAGGSPRLPLPVRRAMGTVDPTSGSPASLAGSPCRTEQEQRTDPRELSQRYMDQHRLEASDRIVDGFCDLVSDGVLVDQRCDERLGELVAKAHKKLAKASDTVTALMALGLLVSETYGRSGQRASDLEERTAKRLQEYRRADGKILLGSLMCDQGKKKKFLGSGSSRHRALTFKLLADALGTAECSLERDAAAKTAWNTVLLDETGFVVDLLHDPGALYEAGSAKQQEYVKLLGLGFGGLEGTLSVQKEFPGRVPRPPWHVEAWELAYGRDMKDFLGKGGFGEVLKGTWADSVVAIKVIKDKNPTDYDVLDFVLEIALLSRLNHPNVMRFWRGCAMLSGGQRSLLMVTEYIERGGLSGVLHGHGGPRLKQDFSIPQVLVLAMGIARGMQYLHSCHVLHLDLKSPNVLIDSDWTPKLCDFGLAKISTTEVGDGFQTTLRGVSPVWAPPEMFDDRAEAMTEKADVYSMGILFYELAFRKLPFQEVNQRQLPRVKYEGQLPELPRDSPEDFTALVRACCAHKPPARPSMSGVVARVMECAKTRAVDPVDVIMPCWDDEAQETIGRAVDQHQEQERIRELQQRQAQLQRERRELQAKVERVREQRRRLQQLHLGSSGIAEEGVMPQPHASESSVAHAGVHLVGATGAASLAPAGLDNSKQACCASQ